MVVWLQVCCGVHAQVTAVVCIASRLLQSHGWVAWSDVGPVVALFLAKVASVRLNSARNWPGVAAGVAADVSRLWRRVLSLSVSNGVVLVPPAVATRVHALSYIVVPTSLSVVACAGSALAACYHQASLRQLQDPSE